MSHDKPKLPKPAPPPPPPPPVPEADPMDELLRKRREQRTVEPLRSAGTILSQSAGGAQKLGG